MRWIFCVQNPAANVNFGLRSRRRDQTALEKALGQLSSSSPCTPRRRSGRRRAPRRPSAERGELDRWLLSRLNTLVQTVRERLDDFDAMVAARAVEDFFDGLSNWYIRLSRQRFWAPGAKADPAAMATLHDTLVTVTRLLAPFLPFLAEEIYQNLVRGVEPSAPVQRAPHGLSRRSTPACATQSSSASWISRAWSPVWATPHAKAPRCAAQQPLAAVRVSGGSTFSRAARLGVAR